MRLTDEDLDHLFKFGMGMQRLDHAGEQPWYGRVEPHEENLDWINLWLTEGANTVLPREVEHDGIGGYLFTDPWGGRRRVFPLPEAEGVSSGSANRVVEDRETVARGMNSLSPEHATSAARLEASKTRMQCFLVHFGSDRYPLGVWATPTDYFYGTEAQDSIGLGRTVVESWDGVASWPEWVDFIAWNPPVSVDRWDMYKHDDPISPKDLLSQLRGGLTHSEYMLTYGDSTEDV